MNEKPVSADSISKIKVIILNNELELVGIVTAQTKDSIYIITDRGMTIQIPILKINKIYDYDYFAKNIIYIDAASFLAIGYITLNYERMIADHFSLRTAYGYGYYFEIDFGGGGEARYMNGFNLMANYLIGVKNSKFELGIGLCMTQVKIYPRILEKFYPTFAIDYRYQPRFGGILFRVGLSEIFATGGINLSLGYTF
ncbi:MAG: hypothetical protein HZB41_09775 [Ignavibacteriae bacterium]|nr:hypothetical protein [Ignavibacteriota bacterium]